MQILLQDLRYGVRMLLKQPMFTAVAVLTLSLGIGANTAIFSVIDTVLLHPLPFKESERLVSVWSTDLRNPASKKPVSELDLADWRAQSRSFEKFGAWFTMDLTLTGDAEPMRVKVKGMQGDLFGVLGVAPMLGRLLRPGDHYAAALSHRLWQRRFNADPKVVGQSVRLGDESYTIVGVMPPDFQFPLEAEAGEVWLTWDYARLPPAPTSRRDARLAEAIGRLRPGVTLMQAQSEMETIAAALGQQYPDTNREIGVRLAPLATELTEKYRQELSVLLGAVGVVLLIGCVNVANLLLARASGRRREMAVRAALGANRMRIGLQLLSESLLLAVAGGVLGCLVAMWGVDVLLALNPTYLPGMERIGVNERVLAFTFFLSLLTGLLFGLAPAWHASKIDLTTALKDGARTATDSVRGRRFRNAMVVAEIALSLVLLFGAALLINSFWRLRQVNPGFDPRNLLSFRLSLSYQKYTAADAGEFFRKLQARLQAIPGVRVASSVFPLPFHGDPDFENLDTVLDTRLEIDGRPMPRSERPLTESTTIQPGYFRALGTRLLAGRDFAATDDRGAKPVAIINEALAHRYFPNEDPVGKRLRVSSMIQPEPEMRQVVGVVADIKPRSLRQEARPEVYVPFAQAPFQEMAVVVKTETDPAAMISAVRAAVMELDREQPIFNVRTFEERLGLSLSQQRFNTLLLTLFSALALALATIGLYGVLAYAVAQRTHEIGIRLALGAQPRSVLKLVIGQGMTLVLVGLAVGGVGALLFTQLIENLLFGVRATDPLTFILVVFVLLAVTLLACWVPARRATKVDPMVALRCE